MVNNNHTHRVLKWQEFWLITWKILCRQINILRTFAVFLRKLRPFPPQEFPVQRVKSIFYTIWYSKTFCVLYTHNFSSPIPLTFPCHRNSSFFLLGHTDINFAMRSWPSHPKSFMHLDLRFSFLHHSTCSWFWDCLYLFLGYMAYLPRINIYHLFYIYIIDHIRPL